MRALGMIVCLMLMLVGYLPAQSLFEEATKDAYERSEALDLGLDLPAPLLQLAVHLAGQTRTVIGEDQGQI